jgi:hypothetical protein
MGETDPGDDERPRRKLSGPWAGTLTVLGVMALLVLRMTYFDRTVAQGSDQGPWLIMGIVLAVICVVGLAVGWLNHFKARRERRNRRKPMSLN